LNYLSYLKNNIHLEPGIKTRFIEEIGSHVEDRKKELINMGYSEADADRIAWQQLGSPQLVAKQIYEVYSQGTWKQALCAALPHFIVAALFGLHLLPNLLSLVCLSICTVITAAVGWFHGRPTWLFPWLGYLFIPPIIVGLLLINLSNQWTWIAALVYIPLAVFSLILIFKNTIKRDWLFISLMLFPIPIVIGWITVFSIGGYFNSFDDLQLYQAASWVALSFMVLALTVVIFIRVRQRWAKAGILIIPEIVMLAAVAITYERINFWTIAVLMTLAITLIFGPALLEKKLKSNHDKDS
jgi:hypothetical protein